MTMLVTLLYLALAAGLLYAGRAFLAWVVPLGLALATWILPDDVGIFGYLMFAAYGAAVAIGGIPALRTKLISGRVLALLKPMFPRMSDTERTALEAGTVWWDAELFGGNPNWQKLVEFKIHGGKSAS